MLNWRLTLLHKISGRHCKRSSFLLKEESDDIGKYLFEIGVAPVRRSGEVFHISLSIFKSSRECIGRMSKPQ